MTKSKERSREGHIKNLENKTANKNNMINSYVGTSQNLYVKHLKNVKIFHYYLKFFNFLSFKLTSQNYSINLT